MTQFPSLLSAGVKAGFCMPALWVNYTPSGKPCRAKIAIIAENLYQWYPTYDTGMQISMAARSKIGYDRYGYGTVNGCRPCAASAEAYLIGAADPINAGENDCGVGITGEDVAWIYDVWKAHDDAIWTSSVAFTIYGNQRSGLGTPHTVNMKAYAIDYGYTTSPQSPRRLIQSWTVSIDYTADCAGPLLKTLTLMDDGTSAVA